MWHHKWFKILRPERLLWKLTLLNIFVIMLAIGLSSWAIYHAACFLVEGMGGFNQQRQEQFNATLFQYLLIFSVIGILSGSMLHFYLTKKIIHPIRRLIASTKQLKKGEYPEPLDVRSEDEVGELIYQYNELIEQLKVNEIQRQKIVSDLSHEFRTPLSNLKGYLHALENGVLEGDKDLYRSLYQESNRLSLMLNQLEQLKEWDIVSSQKIRKKEHVDMAELLTQCVAMFDWKLTRHGIETKIQADSKELFIQIEGIQQVISNLLDNAIQYYDGDRAIRIKGQVMESVYYVSITGPSQPIQIDQKSKLFERFYRIDSSRSRDTGGSGLGLAIAKEIVERHHGEIGIESAGDSNEFWFTLPYKSN